MSLSYLAHTIPLGYNTHTHISLHNTSTHVPAERDDRKSRVQGVVHVLVTRIRNCNVERSLLRVNVLNINV